MSFEDWCLEMEQSDEGRVFLSNMLLDCKTGRIGNDEFCWFRNQIDSTWAAHKLRYGAPPPDRSFLREIRKGGDYEGQLCRNSPISSYGGTCSLVVEFDALRDNDNIDYSTIGVIGRNPEDIIKYLEADVYQLVGTKKGEFNLVWVTLANELETKFSEETALDSSQSKASIARKWLGLEHLNRPRHLVEIQYPNHDCTDGHLHAPTFLEGTSYVYRSVQVPDGWGRTVNLETGELGLPEAVHKANKIPFTPDFHCRGLGKLQQPNYNTDWTALHNELVDPWDDTTSLTELMVLMVCT